MRRVHLPNRAGIYQTEGDVGKPAQITSPSSLLEWSVVALYRHTTGLH